MGTSLEEELRLRRAKIKDSVDARLEGIKLNDMFDSKGEPLTNIKRLRGIEDKRAAETRAELVKIQNEVGLLNAQLQGMAKASGPSVPSGPSSLPPISTGPSTTPGSITSMPPTPTTSNPPTTARSPLDQLIAFYKSPAVNKSRNDNPYKTDDKNDTFVFSYKLTVNQNPASSMVARTIVPYVNTSANIEVEFENKKVTETMFSEPTTSNLFFLILMLLPFSSFDKFTDDNGSSVKMLYETGKYTPDVASIKLYQDYLDFIKSPHKSIVGTKNPVVIQDSFYLRRYSEFQLYKTWLNSLGTSGPSSTPPGPPSKPGSALNPTPSSGAGMKRAQKITNSRMTNPQLKKRLHVLIGMISSGNNSQENINEMLAITDILKEEKYLTPADHRKIYAIVGIK